ncbi:PHD-finger domain-containing protein [Hirsutella rhossiliensis]|uniref:PHD-finger domain-containing protein n=1 Tax=Hirsutella rhossiliensis TaxID=111463 RepID=A0A9P8MUG6_9HYPO|nr:PHD-finger domain-containing protein [Hirsutella rhossiliensis]KAH0960659.1 PHD-finger domain-containing protein [Hirsutella rhossiliensis]
MPSRKRPIQAVDDGPSATSRDAGSTILNRIRNMWQFANFCQWIYIFGKSARIDESIDIEEIEAECLKPDSTLLADLALAILKLVSSHRGLTHDVFDDQLRKQYLTRGRKSNPLGDADAPRKFADLDLIAKIKVLQQLTQWTMVHPERIRDRMEEQKDVEQTSWRIEPYGWDREDRTYYVLDDNRVYRLTEVPPAQAPPKPKSKYMRSGRRSSKRRRPTPSKNDPATSLPGEQNDNESTDDGLGGRAWECVAVTLQEVQELVMSLGKTRDENEKMLRRQMETHLIPILEKQEERQKQKQLQRERELLSLAKMASAKRSSRIAGKVERQKQEDKAKVEEEQLRAAEVSKRREEQGRLKMEQERDFRTFSRQRRLQEREARRLQHEDELAQLSEDSRAASASAGRISERRRQAEIERNRQALKELSQEEEEWVFDCACGEEEADRQEFHFVCEPCRRRNESKPSKESIELKLDTITCSTVDPQATEQSDAGQSTTPAMAGDGPSKQRKEAPLSKGAASLSADTPLYSALESEQNAQPFSTAPPQSLTNRSGDRPDMPPQGLPEV